MSRLSLGKWQAWEMECTGQCWAPEVSICPTLCSEEGQALSWCTECRADALGATGVPGVPWSRHYDHEGVRGEYLTK